MDERERPGLPPVWFFLLVVTLGVAVAALTITLGALRGDAVHGETTYAEGNGAWGLMVELLGIPAMRVLVAIAAGTTASATGFVARRFTHSAGIGVFAAVLVALDPALLVDGQLAVPAALLRFAAVASLALALGAHPAFHWMVPIPIIIGALLEPWFFAWGAALTVLMLLRGHIFAAPKHLWHALLQGSVIPAVVAVPGLIVIGQTVGASQVQCAADPARALLLLDAPWYAPGVVAVANPLVAIGGLGLLIGLAAAAAIQVGSAFRLARLPGRVQIRLPGRLGRTPSRALWLALLAMALPAPQVAIVLGAVAMALGVQALVDDSPAFAAAIAVAVVLFSAGVLVRLFPIVVGDATPGSMDAILDWLPWVEPQACA